MSGKVNAANNPFSGGSFRNWMQLFIKNGPIEKKYLLRAAFVTFMSLFFMPVRVISRLRFKNTISKTKINKDPVILIGHFRSGTTYLHNLLVRDPQFGYITTTHTLMPEMFLMGNWVSKLLAFFLPEKRYMDNIKISPEAPEEPEFAMGNISQYCFFHGFSFPKQMLLYFKKYVLFENVSKDVLAKWKKDYLYIIKSATYAFKGKQIFLKNPTDTARIKHVLEIFPNAKFIFIYRNPYTMFPSNKNFYSKSISNWQFNEITNEELEENIFFIYDNLITRYEQTKHLIPQNNLVEVKYEELETNPIKTLQNIYATLHLNGFENTKNNFLSYVNSQKSYEKNKYDNSSELSNKISSRWKSHIQRWGYEPASA